MLKNCPSCFLQFRQDSCANSLGFHMDTIRNRCLPINLSLARAQIRIHPPTVRDSERNRLQGSSWLPQGQMRCAISEILGLTSSKKSASPRSVASWPGKYGYPSLACGDRVTQVTTTAEGLTHQHPPSGSRNLARVASSLTCCGEAQTWRWESRTLQGGEAAPWLGEEAAMAAAMVVAVLERSSRLLLVGVGKERRAREAAVARGDKEPARAAAGDDEEAIIIHQTTSGWLLPLPPHLAAARET